MEPLYAKLYDEFVVLKAKRFTELDDAQKDQEVKFATCIAAAEELIQHLRNENDVLRDRVEELMTLSRSTLGVPSMDYQKLLAEEIEKSETLIEKNKSLYEEVERLQRLQQEGALFSRACRGSDSGKAGTPGVWDDRNRGSTGRSGKRRRRSSGSDMDGKISPHVPDKVDARLENDSHEEVASLDTHEDAEKPDCRVRAEDIAGELWNDHSTTECLFQVLIQHALVLNFSVTQVGGICITVLHETSGYSFTLTCLRSDDGMEMMYRMLSLGTLERIAPEWMREVIKFSISMFPVFLQRIADVTKNRCAFR